MGTVAAHKKPWPSEAVMIVAALAGEELRENMEGLVECACRDCGAALHADTRTVRLAEELPERYGRSIEFFCIDCCVQYDVRTIGRLMDHRRRPAE